MTSPIEALLSTELDTLIMFRQALDDEQEVLKNNQPDHLPAIVERKSALTGRLGAVLADRERALSTAGFAAGRAGMEAWLLSLPPESKAHRQWQNLLRLTEEAHSVHATNGKLIALHLQNTQQALAALLSASGHPLTYGPDGHQRLGMSAASGRRFGYA